MSLTCLSNFGTTILASWVFIGLFFWKVFFILFSFGNGEGRAECFGKLGFNFPSLSLKIFHSFPLFGLDLASGTALFFFFFWMLLCMYLTYRLSFRLCVSIQFICTAHFIYILHIRDSCSIVDYGADFGNRAWGFRTESLTVTVDGNKSGFLSFLSFFHVLLRSQPEP